MIKFFLKKFFNNEKGFGFIKDEESNEDVFVHKTGLVAEHILISLSAIKIRQQQLLLPKISPTLVGNEPKC